MDDTRSHSHTSNGDAAWQASTARRVGHCVLRSAVFEHSMGVAILLNFVVVIVETDEQAKGLDTPKWAEVMAWCLLVLFVLELLLKIFTLRFAVVSDRWNVFDIIVIGADLIISLCGLFLDDLFSISMLRVLRLVRLIRATRMIELFPELRLMLAGLLGALNAIFWGSILLVSVLLIWSVIAVQFIHPLNLEVARNTIEYDQCPRCVRAYESTFQAFLTFCCQIVAGDSWGRETIPIIERYPQTALFFTGVFMSVGMALLNLILGVVVNVATEERERIAKEMETERVQERMAAHDQLYQMCNDMDEDGSGHLDLEEVKHGFDNNPSFRSLLERMEIGRGDLDFVWTILDSDKTGKLTATEFVTQIYQLKSSDTQFLIAYIRFYLTEMKGDLRDGQNRLKEELKLGQMAQMTKLRGGQEELQGKLRLGQEELQRKLAGGQEELKKKLGGGQEELRKKLRSGQGELQKRLRAGQERLRHDIHKAMNFSGAFVEFVDDEPEEVDPEEPPAETKTVRRCSIDDPGEAVNLSLQFSCDDGQALKVCNDANDVTICDLPPDQYAERLVRLNSVWQQCLISIEDVRERQSDLSALLASQAQCLVSVIQSAPSPSKEVSNGTTASTPHAALHGKVLSLDDGVTHRGTEGDTNI